MSPRIVSGFDYRDGLKHTLSMAQWRLQIERVEQAGGSARRVAGDLTAFDKLGRMQLEVYDREQVRRG